MIQQTAIAPVVAPRDGSIPRAWALLMVTMVIWASSFAGLRRVLQETDALSLTCARMIIAAVPLAALALYWRVPLPRGRDLAVTLGAGVSGFTAYHLALNFGMRGVGAGTASLIVATAPLWTALLAWTLLSERLGPRGWIGLGLSFAGVAYLSIGGDETSEMLGVGLVLMAAVLAAVNAILQKKLLETYRPLQTAVLAGLAGCVPFALLLPWRWDELAPMSTEAWWILTYLGVVPVAFGYLLYTSALKVLPASRSSQMYLVVPPLSALLAWLWLGEPPSERLAGAGALVLCGVFVGNARRRRRRALARLPASHPRAASWPRVRERLHRRARLSQRI